MRYQTSAEGLNSLNAMGSLSLSAPHRVLIVGCAYAGITALTTLLALRDGKVKDTMYQNYAEGLKGTKSKNGVEITVIDSRDGYFHSVGAPLAHVTPKFTSKMWKRFSHINEFRSQKDLTFKHGSVTKIDPEAKVAEWQDRSGKTQHQGYDYVIVSTGLKRHWPAVPKYGSYHEYMKDGADLHKRITGGSEASQKGRKVVIIGAGAVGIEFAGEIKNYYPEIEVTLVHSRKEVLSSEPLPSEVKEKVKDLLIEEGVKVVLGNRATITDLDDGMQHVTLANGETLTAHLALDTTRKGSPTTGFMPADSLDENKEMMITTEIHMKNVIPNHEAHFGAGDCVAWTGIKRAGGAMYMGEVASANVYASILNSEKAEGEEKLKLATLTPYENVIGIAVGKQCLTYGKDGMKFGVQLMQDYFGPDLGWTGNIAYLGLTDLVEKDVLEGKEVQMSDVGLKTVPTAA
ncbi:FAD/NAD(P)-binding domain-containing protein [Aaosphaeria arxii CBS 175.79]|uniref:FAD/NAD(P)-binding domain-containing protein n=1 Tax=Aaosphaeria arxii CBS 175.79 TaxID=1450172 RepID=A0A6A5XQD0_9PLEO|nr:FAD/NAD(P)-binding domain-containing protein [Aaosphaeria arxii CBS 175.79]KAF2015372.1 FAD/NAD(P)-binding domain-containing protein [Aaosphaeria arxii CBS 175.79]